jgi:hypothetical protein
VNSKLVKNHIDSMRVSFNQKGIDMIKRSQLIKDVNDNASASTNNKISRVTFRNATNSEYDIDMRTICECLSILGNMVGFLVVHFKTQQLLGLLYYSDSKGVKQVRLTLSSLS